MAFLDLWVWFSTIFAFSGFMGIVLCKNSFTGELFWHFQIYGYDFQQFFAFSGFMGIVYVRIHLLVSCFGISGFMGMIFRKFSRFMGIPLSEKFLRIYGWYFYDLNRTTPYRGNSSYPPPPGVSICSSK